VRDDNDAGPTADQFVHRSRRVAMGSAGSPVLATQFDVAINDGWAWQRVLSSGRPRLRVLKFIDDQSHGRHYRQRYHYREEEHEYSWGRESRGKAEDYHRTDRPT